MVVVREDTETAVKSLVAYVVARAGRTLEVMQLRGALGERLPQQMIPSAIMVLEKLPLTPTCKLDRKALPAPDFNAYGAEWSAPRTPEEEILCSLFGEVLGVEAGRSGWQLLRFGWALPDGDSAGEPHPGYMGWC